MYKKRNIKKDFYANLITPCILLVQAGAFLWGYKEYPDVWLWGVFALTHLIGSCFATGWYYAHYRQEIKNYENTYRNEKNNN